MVSHSFFTLETNTHTKGLESIRFMVSIHLPIYFDSRKMRCHFRITSNINTNFLSFLIYIFFNYNNKECRIMIYARQVEVYWLEISRNFKRIFKDKKLFEKLISIYIALILSTDICSHDNSI
jgi:hypothetical protein